MNVRQLSLLVCVVPVLAVAQTKSRAADFDRDGLISILDYLKLSQNFEKSGDFQ